jgi:2-polyprenyl-3-methyl-5-hydroxy-6-metoxy-1,4-benzoquinol methylase
MPTSKYYNDEAEKFFDETVNLDMNDLYGPFLNLIPEKGKILDAGCGSGRDSRYFKSKGYKVTAFDYSEKLVKLASDFIGDTVLHMSFDDLTSKEEFDGVWACASLLHVPKNKMKSVIDKLAEALKLDGILYASFKYGDKEEVRKGRLFSDYTESTFQALIKKISSLKIIKHWKTADVRPDRKGEYWFNVLIRKES